MSVIFITGPARGIGEALARRLAAKGHRLALAGLEPERLAALATALGPQHVWFECDVTRQATLDRAVAGTVSALGGIDVVVANAGIAAHGTVAVTPPDIMARVVEVNLIGVMRTVSATLSHVIARRGYYLLVSSAAALASAPGLAAYAGSKGGVEQFGNALRMEVKHKGVGVGLAHPSWIDTDMVRDATAALSTFREFVAMMPGPFGKVTSLDACAAAMVRAIERRERKVFVPKSLSTFSALRQLLKSEFAEGLQGGKTGRVLDDIEKEVATHGRHFGEHSVEKS
jgi:short-subunit dehydrogenase